MGNCFFTGLCNTQFSMGGYILTEPGQFYGKISQQGQLQWLMGGKNFHTEGLVPDQSGGCVLSGRGTSAVAGQINIGGFTLPQQGSYLIYCSTSGSITSFTPSLKSGPMTRDAGGNLYVTGGLEGSLTLGSVTVFSSGAYDVLLSKYSPTGSLLWSVVAGGPTGSEIGKQINLDPYGNIFLSGLYADGNAQFGNYNFPNKGYWDLFVLKFDPTGSLTWAKAVGGPETDYAGGLGTDKVGNAYLLGTYQQSISLDATTLQTSFSNFFLTRIGNYSLGSGRYVPVEDKIIQVWPNPVQDYITLSLPDLSAGIIEMELVDLQGRVLYHRQHMLSNKKITLNSLSSLPPGPYLTRVSQGGKHYCVMVTKQ